MKLFSEGSIFFSVSCSFCRKAVKELLHHPHVDAVALRVVPRIQVVAHHPNHRVSHHDLGQDLHLGIEIDHIVIKDVTMAAKNIL